MNAVGTSGEAVPQNEIWSARRTVTSDTWEAQFPKGRDMSFSHGKQCTDGHTVRRDAAEALS